MMYLRQVLLGISVAAGSLRGGLLTGTALPSPTDMSTAATPITTPLLATASSTTAVANEIIERHFKDVPAGGGSVRANFAGPRGAVSSYETCSAFDWSTIHGTDDERVQLIMDQLGLTHYCHPVTGKAKKDPTCKAFWASTRANMELQEKNIQPVFGKYMLINWYENNPGHFPSWGSGGDVEVDYSNYGVGNPPVCRGVWNKTARGASPPRASRASPRGHHHQQGSPPGDRAPGLNAVSGFAICEIIQVVLRQNNDQVSSGTCGPAAILAARNHANPAGSIKAALQLYWTGTVPELKGGNAPCDYIYDQVPGVIPYGPGQPGWNGPVPKPPGGNERDQMQARGRPLQAAGLQFMFTQAMGTALDRRVMGSCGPALFQLVFKGQSKRSMVATQAAQGTTIWGQVQMACPILGACTWSSAGIDRYCKTKRQVQSCKELLQIPHMTGAEADALKQWAAVMQGSTWAQQDPTGFYKETFDAANAPGGRINTFLANLQRADIQIADGIQAGLTPSMDQAKLNDACSAKGGAILFVFSDFLLLEGSEAAPVNGPRVPIQSLEPCNHWVWLESCSAGAGRNVVVIWSWGKRWYMTKNHFMHALQEVPSLKTHSPVCGHISVPAAAAKRTGYLA